jgi:hypothetical protein
MASNDEGVLSSFFEKYSNEKEFTYVNITPKLFEMFADMEAGEDDDLIELMKSLTSVKILAADSTSKSSSYFTEVQGLIKNKAFEELAFIRDGDENVRIMVKEANSKINELLVLVSGSHNFVVIDLVGDINLKDLKKMSKFKMKGMEYLEKADENK